MKTKPRPAPRIHHRIFWLCAGFELAVLIMGVCASRAAESSVSLDKELTQVTPSHIIQLWPGIAPGEKADIGEEKDTTNPGSDLIANRRIIRLGNVSKPEILVYRPAADKNTGAAVVVCPGGGYRILAFDLEGTEVCEWLNSIGVTGVLLKYRVPGRAGLERQTPPLQDLQRAFGLVRQNAAPWGVDPHRIGVMGFSAGAHLSAVLCARNLVRAYPLVDDADGLSCHPDFALLIYPAFLTVKEKAEALAPEVAVTTNNPPAFIVMAEDDPLRMETALYYTLALKQARVPVELHIYPTGGHGYGLRRTKHLVTTWPERAMEWMKSRNIIK
jgi:acetyl esterase/lipase